MSVAPRIIEVVKTKKTVEPIERSGEIKLTPDPRYVVTPDYRLTRPLISPDERIMTRPLDEGVRLTRPGDIGRAKRRAEAAALLGRLGGLARGRKLTKRQLSAQGRKAVRARWAKKKQKEG